MDWTEDADLHKWFKDWREETELLLDTVLSNIRNQESKLKFVSLWAGKEARTYLNMVDKDKKDNLKICWIHIKTGPNPNLMKLQYSHSPEP